MLPWSLQVLSAPRQTPGSSIQLTNDSTTHLLLASVSSPSLSCLRFMFIYKPSSQICVVSRNSFYSQAIPGLCNLCYRLILYSPTKFGNCISKAPGNATSWLSVLKTAQSCHTSSQSSPFPYQVTLKQFPFEIGSHSASQVGLDLPTLIPQPPEYWRRKSKFFDPDFFFLTLRVKITKIHLFHLALLK